MVGSFGHWAAPLAVWHAGRPGSGPPESESFKKATFHSSETMTPLQNGTTFPGIDQFPHNHFSTLFHFLQDLTFPDLTAWGSAAVVLAP